MTCREVGERFIEFVQQQCAGEPDSVPVLLAHNLVSFDHRVMTIEFQKCGLEWPSEWHYIDTVLLARKLFPQQDNSQVGSFKMIVQFKRANASQLHATS